MATEINDEKMIQEARRQRIVEQAVAVADEWIQDESDGTNEEIDYLTAAVMQRFVQMVHNRLQNRLLSYELSRESQPSVKV